ncbi:hypothetical protein HYV86_06750 [Candidatus Woesearchaeota archaeon]|nr:hypothetical protein [Candidatus Woesearchaeota archaeon]
MRKIAIMVVMLLVISSSVFAMSWERPKQTAVKSCEDKDWLFIKKGMVADKFEQRRLMHSDVGQQALAPGQVKGMDMFRKPFTHSDSCLDGKTLQEVSCSNGAGTRIGKFFQTHRVTCTKQCNPATKERPYAWCS